MGVYFCDSLVDSLLINLGVVDYNGLASLVTVGDKSTSKLSQRSL